MNSIRKQFVKYVSQNVLGMIGISLYILADTFFISQAVGASGITALNLVLPVYSIIFAIGQMIGVGSAICFTLAKGQEASDSQFYFGNAIFFATLFNSLFILIGIFAPESLLTLLGADAEIVSVGLTYTRIFLCFAPCFSWNHICNAFVRNDGNPTIAMLATLCSSLFNIVFDYLLMFPLGMGMPGAALATALSPLLGVGICCIHLLSKKSTLRLIIKPNLHRLWKACRLGVPSFIGEFSSALITMVFNFLILDLAGNIGVAAYGVVANCALVGSAIFGGLSSGLQPLVTTSHSKGQKKEVKTLIRMGILTSLFLATLLYVGIYFSAQSIADLFNKDQLSALNQYAIPGLRLYFTGFFFAGINMVAAICLSSVEKAKEAFIISISRGMILILFFAILLGRLFGMEGVWLSFAATELVTLIYSMKKLL